MSQFFIAAAGSNSTGTGTILLPWATFTHAYANSVDGDTLSGKGGDTIADNIVATNAGGARTINSYGTGQVTINGGSTVVTFQSTDMDGWILDNVTFINTNATNTIRNLFIIFDDGLTYTRGITISGCTITGGFLGVQIKMTNLVGFVGNILIENNTVSGSVDVGIDIFGNNTGRMSFSNVNVTGNTVHDINGFSTGGSSGVGIIVGSTSAAIGLNYIQNNHVFNCGITAKNTFAAGGPAGLFPYEASYVICQNNVVHDIYGDLTTAGQDGIGLDIDENNTNCQMINNLAYNCQGPGLTLYSVLVAGSQHVMAGNICINCCTAGGDGTAVWLDGSDACDVYNNTIVSNSTFPVLLIGGGCASNKRILNNCFVGPKGGSSVVLPADITGLIMDGNYHQSGDGAFHGVFGGTAITSFATWQSTTGLETSGLAAGHAHFVQPQPPPAITPSTMSLARVYSPDSSSPLLGAGVDLFGTYGISPGPDILGNPWTQNTIGAIYAAGNPNAYAATVYADNPIGFWPLGETATVLGVVPFVDSVATFPQGAWTAAALNQAVLNPGDGAPSVLCNGTSTQGFTPSVSTPYVSSTFTLEFVVTFTSLTSTNQTIVSCNDASKGGQATFDAFMNLTKLNFSVRDTLGGFTTGNLAGVTFATGTTYHVILTANSVANTLTATVNRTPATFTLTATTNTTTMEFPQIYFGNEASQTRWLHGNLSTVSLYTSVLSSTRINAHYDTFSVASYSVVGPIGASVGVASAAITVTPTSVVTDTVTIAVTSGSGTVATSPLSWSASNTLKTFTATGSAKESLVLTLTSSSGLAIEGSPFTLPIAVPYTITGPASMLSGHASTVTATPAASTTDVATWNDGGIGGAFVPPTFTSSNSSAHTAAYTAPVLYFGPITISATTTGKAMVAPLITTTFNVGVDAYASKWGNLIFQTNTTGLGGNSKHIPALITAMGDGLVVKCNGNVVQISDPLIVLPPFTRSAGLDGTYQQFVECLFQCGGVASLSMVNAGNISYTAPTISETGGSPITPATYGTPVLDTGLISYAVGTNGTGHTVSFAAQLTVSGQTPTVPAWVWVTVVSGVVTAVAPKTGSALSYGVGYTGTTHSGIPVVGGTGTGLTITATVGQYIQSWPVIDPGEGYQGLPEYTISDATGSGATVVPTMTGPLSTDTLTCSYPAGLFAVTVNGQGGIVPGAVDAPMVNWVGQTEGDGQYSTGFNGPTTMAVGGNLGQLDSKLFGTSHFPYKNKIKSGSFWSFLNIGTTTAVLDPATHYPVSWTPGGGLTSDFYGFATANTPSSQYTGIWNLVYDDDFYATPSAAPNPTYVNLFDGGSTGITFAIQSASGATLPSLTAVVTSNKVASITINSGGSGLQAVLLVIAGGGGTGAVFVGTVAGGVLTACTQINGGASYTSVPTVTVIPLAMSGGAVTIPYSVTYTNGPNTGGRINLSIEILAGADGLQHCRNPWVFAPNNTLDRSNPYATDDNFVALFSNNGNGIGVARNMSNLITSGVSNMIDESDMVDPNWCTWNPYITQNTGLPGPPNSPTFSGVCTSGSTSVTGIADTSFLAVGNSIVGTGIPGGFGIDAFTTITALTSSTITLSKHATITGTQTLSRNPTSTGQCTFNFARKWDTTVTPNVYTSTNLATTSDSFGPYFPVTGGPLGVNDNGRVLSTPADNVEHGIVELRSLLPHGLKTGMYPGFNGTFTATSTTTSGITTVPIGAGGGTTILAGMLVSGTGIPSGTTISTVNSATSITLSHAPTTSGTPTLTCQVAVPWSTSGVQPLEQLVVGPIWVTGPTTIAYLVAIAVDKGAGTSAQTINSAVEIPIFYQCILTAPQGYEPYESFFQLCANWPTTIAHTNVPWVASDALYAHIGTVAAGILGPDNILAIEVGDEPWNRGGPGNTESVWLDAMAALVAYYPSGTSLYPHYTPTGTVESYVTNGAAFPSGLSMNALRSANIHYVIANAFAAAGGNIDNVKIIYGIQFSIVDNPQINTIKTFDLPQHYIAAAPYVDLEVSQYNFMSQPAGWGSSAVNPNWPVSALNDWSRHMAFLDNKSKVYVAALKAAFAGTTLQLCGYEGGFDTWVTGIPFVTQMQWDCLYHESARDAIHAYFLGLQYGNINVPDSGYSFFNYFQLFDVNQGPGPTWYTADGTAMPIGDATGNQFLTPQGGLPANGLAVGFTQSNVSPGLTAINDWIGGGAPSVTSISPNHGLNAGSTAVTITGTGFTGATAVDFGANAGTSLVVVDDTSITVHSPSGTGVVDVTVTTPSGTSSTMTGDRFTYGATVTGISPSNGPAAGGTTVTITGVGFTGATAVKFGATSGTSLSVVSDTMITIHSPAGTGVVDITVVTPGNTSATSSADLFTYGVAVTGISPTSGPTTGGTVVTVSGSGFTGATDVKFGTTSGTSLVVASDTSITIHSPAGTGVVDVTVVTPGGTSPTLSADRFTYTVAVTGLSPPNGPTTGGTVVTITGTGFTGATAVKFGTTNGTNLSVVSNTQITVHSPAGTGVVHVTVVTPGGTSPTSSADLFAYEVIISSLSTTRGPIAGGTAVTITGTGFTGATEVDFGANAGTSLVAVNDTTITIVSPAGRVGTVHVTVVTPGGTSATSNADVFTYTTSTNRRRWFAGLRRPSARISV